MKDRRFRFVVFSVVIILACMLVMAQGATVKDLLDEVETLRDADNYTSALAKLKEAEKMDKDNPEILWKIARAYFDLADQDEGNIEVQKANVYPGFEYAKKCVEIAPNVAGGHQYYAILIGRVGETEAERRNRIQGEMARSSLCLKTAAHFDGTTIHDDGSTSLFHHVLNCRKPWCEICGGKQGVISKTRKRAIFSKFQPTDYGLRQFVLTVPPEIRPNLQSRKKLNSLFEDAKQVMAKYFGDPAKTKTNSRGYAKEYSFGDNLALGYLHLFGDPDKQGFYRHGDAGTFHPHINIHIFEKSDNLSISKETLGNIRKDWAAKLQKYGSFEGDVDIHYLWLSKSAKARKKLHKVKYMVKPYLRENIQKVIQDDNLDLLELLTIELKGCQWLRFWGGLSTAKKAYRDEAGIFPDNIEEIENRINDKLIFRSVTEWDLKGELKKKLKRVAENFYEERIGGFRSEGDR